MTTRPTPVNALVFDFDGTIVDSMSAFADIAAQVMPRRLPIDAATARQRYLETSGIPFFQQLELLFPNHAANAATAKEFEETKLAGYFDEPLFDDAAETIRHLREHGIRVAVSSNNFQELVDRFVARAGIAFDLVCGFRDGFAKGEEHFAHIEQRFGVDRGRIAFVGDSLKDGERAAASGIAFIGKTGIFTREQFAEHFPGAQVIAHLAELKGIVG